MEQNPPTGNQSEKLVNSIPSEVKLIQTPQGDPLINLLSKLAEAPAIQDLINNYFQNQKEIEILKNQNEKEIVVLENEKESKFHAFLLQIDKHQKIFNIAIIILSSCVVALLKQFEIITKETAMPVLLLIVGLTIKDPITSFLKSFNKPVPNKEN